MGRLIISRYKSKFNKNSSKLVKKVVGFETFRLINPFSVLSIKIEFNGIS